MNVLLFVQKLSTKFTVKKIRFTDEHTGYKLNFPKENTDVAKVRLVYYIIIL